MAPEAADTGQQRSILSPRRQFKQATKCKVTTIPLRAWIERARSSISKKDYLESAVALALKLIINLRGAAGANNDPQCCKGSALDNFLSSWNESENDGCSLSSFSGEEERKGDGLDEGLLASPLSPFKIEQLVPENVLVSFDADGHHQKLPAQNSSMANLKPIETNIQLAGSDLGDIPENNKQPSERDMCLALGKIFLEIFSQGQVDPLLLIGHGTGGAVDNGNKLIADLTLGDIDLQTGTMTRAAKRSLQPDASVDAWSTRHLRAKALLQERGLPGSICRLVFDLLEAEQGNPYVSDTSMLSLKEVQFDLTQMTKHPHRFLHNCTSPTKARESTALFSQTDGKLYGRESEMAVLKETAKKIFISDEFRRLDLDNVDWELQGAKPQNQAIRGEFPREAIFLSGHSGSGKSSIIEQLAATCRKNNWFVLTCKFDRKVVPQSVLVQLFNEFFGNFCVATTGNEGVLEAFHRISQFISSSIDVETLGQLSNLFKNFNHAFGLAINFAFGMTSEGVCGRRKAADDAKYDSSNSVIGSGSNRLNYLFHIILKAVLSGGRPVAIILDDLQWSDPLTMGILGDLIQNAFQDSAFSNEGDLPQQGLLLLGSYRDNEVDENGFVMNQINTIEQTRGINVTRLSVGELPEHEINRMLSFKLCLPIRHTRELAKIIHHKTRGLPMYVLEFLRSIVQSNLLTFSVRQARWTWDDTAIDMQMISEGVLEHLTRKLKRLPHDVVEMLKVVSCLGFQFDSSTIKLIDLGQFASDLFQSLEVAVTEGLVEKAGPVYAFSHDMLQESTYNLIEVDKRKPMHVMIGRSLAQELRFTDNPELCMLACDQINICKDVDGLLDPVDRALFARINLAAGKHSIGVSSFDQARRYFDAGISLLCAEPWKKQYDLCLELHEMMIGVSFMDGKVQSVLSLLDLVLSNARSTIDVLNARALRAKFLASQEHHGEAMNELLGILLEIGEEFPQLPCLPDVIDEVEKIQLMLDGLTKEKVVGLPIMRDAKKLKAMELMSQLINMIIFYNPMLMHLVGIRMVQLTFEFGFCEESISGLAYAANALIHLSDDIQLAGQISLIAASFIRGNTNEQCLWARLTPMICNVRIHFEPLQSTFDFCLHGYHSAEIVGDTDSGMLCGLLCCIAKFLSIPDLPGLQNDLIKFLHKNAKNKRISILHCVMSYFDGVTALMGNRDSCIIDSGIDMKTNEKLYLVAELNQNSYLLQHTILNQILVRCYFREWQNVASWAEKYQQKNKPKRSLDFLICYFEGIAAMSLARETKEGKWRIIGENATRTMSELAKSNTWNFENKLKLLQAELFYLNERHEMADLEYQKAISSAHQHRLFHEEALSCELFGIFLMENKKTERGIEQLRLAMEKYMLWGASKKADDVKDFIEVFDRAACLRGIG